MTKTTLLISALLVCGLFTIISCQKQDTLPQPSKSNTNNVTLARTDSKDYRIPEDTAVKWTSRFRQLNKTTFNNKMPNNLLLPINGIQQMLQLCVENRKELSGIRVYLSVNKDGQITALYVPADKEGNDILYYNNEANFTGKNFTGEDGTDPCPPCNNSINILNNPD